MINISIFNCLKMPSIPKNTTPLVVILGPTASGKTEAAIKVAESIHGEIISCDSRLFYRGMDIGTAKPTQEERGQIPHHMIDIADPDEPLSLAVFQQKVESIIEECHNRDKIPMLVGGTGQYINAITEGYQIPNQIPASYLRYILEKIANDQGIEELFRYLQVLDPEAASIIDMRNIRRVIRALEVVLLTGKKFSDQKKKGLIKYKVIKIGINLNRSDLYQRIDTRIDQMFMQGFVAEVEALIGKGYTTNLPSMSAIGYNEIALYFFGRLTLEECVVLIKRKTRQFVRRQANWFKLSDPDIFWVTPSGNMYGKIIDHIREELRNAYE